MYDTTLHGMGDILRTFVVNPLEFSQQNRSFRFVLHVCEFVELLCHGNFGPAKILVRGTKIPGKLVRPDHFSLKI